MGGQAQVAALPELASPALQVPGSGTQVKEDDLGVPLDQPAATVDLWSHQGGGEGGGGGGGGCCEVEVQKRNPRSFLSFTERLLPSANSTSGQLGFVLPGTRCLSHNLSKKQFE